MIEKGWDNVSRRLDWVSSQYADGSREHEEVVRLLGRMLPMSCKRKSFGFVIRTRLPG